MVGDLKPRPSEWPSSVIYRQGDLNELTVADVRDFAPEIFIHLAATFERTNESLDFWEQNFHHNVTLSHTLMTRMQSLGTVRRVVFASSYLIYDSSLYLFDSAQAGAVRLTEETQVRPRNLTGMAKLSHEQELEFLGSFETTKFSTVSVRIFRGYGRGSRCVVSRWVRALMAGERIQVFRDEGIFDYIFARDSAEGLARIAAANESPRVVNLGTGVGTRVADVVSVLQRRFPSAEIDRVESDIRYEASAADTSLLAATLSWVPSTSLQEGVDRIIEYEEENAHRDVPLGGVLVSSASGKVPLLRHAEASVNDGWAGGFVVAGDSNPNAITAFVAEHFWLMPKLNDVSIEDVIAELVVRGIRFIIPTRDGELEYFSTNQKRLLDAGIHVMVSPVDAIRTCADKLRFSAFCEEQGLPSIPTVELGQGLANGVDRFVVKPRFGAGGDSIGLNLDAGEVAAWGARLDAPVVQPYVEGPEFSVDAYRTADGEGVRSIVRSRDVVIDGESKVSTIVRDEEIGELVQRLLVALDARGHAVVQVLRSPNGPVIVECNPRVGGASTLSFAAGLRSIDWFITESLGGSLEAMPFQGVPSLRLVRIPKDLFQ